MSTKRNTQRGPARNGAARSRSGPAGKRRPPAARRGGIGFTRLFSGTVAVLVLLTGALTVANLARDPALSSESAAYRSGADFDVYTLHRAAPGGADPVDGETGPDTIRGDARSGAGDGTIVFSAPRIQEFVALPGYLAVVTLDDDDASALEIVSLAEGSRHEVRLPATGRVEGLRASASDHLIGYSFTGTDPAAGVWKSLYVFDVTARSEAPREILGLNQEPISAWNVAFVPDTGSLVVQTDDRSIFLADARRAGTVSPIGRHGEMLGFLPGTAQLVVADISGTSTVTSTINLADGTVTPLELQPVARGPESFEGTTVVLDADGRYARVITEYDQGAEHSVVTITDRNGSSVLYRPDAGRPRIRDVCVSPDGGYLAVETFGTDAVGDLYPNLPAPSPIHTALVDLDTGKTTRNLTGFLPDWCR